MVTTLTAGNDDGNDDDHHMNDTQWQRGMPLHDYGEAQGVYGCLRHDRTACTREPTDGLSDKSCLRCVTCSIVCATDGYNMFNAYRTIVHFTAPVVQ